MAPLVVVPVTWGTDTVNAGSAKMSVLQATSTAGKVKSRLTLNGPHVPVLGVTLKSAARM